MKGTPNVDNLRAALIETARRFRRMRPREFLRTISELGLAGGFKETDKIGTTLSALAEQGSIDAAAALVVIDDDKPKVGKRALDALAAVAARSPALTDELVHSTFVTMFEDFAEGEVKAGRMFIVLDPKTGEKRYGSVKK